MRIIILLIFLMSFAFPAWAANYPLEITQPQPNLNTNNRYYKAYPGIEYEVPVGVFGGMFPFTYELITYPSGMTVGADTGIITWPNPTTSSSPHPVSIQVTDDENNTDMVEWTITVTTSGFVFLDVDAAGGGNGTIGSPLNSLVDIWGVANTTTHTGSYSNHFLYFREGTYGLEGGRRASCPGQHCQVQLNVGYQPHVWMAYPGETAVIDHDLASGSNGLFIALQHGAANLWFSGFTFKDMLNHAIRAPGREINKVFYDNTFFNAGPGLDGANSSFIMLSGGAVITTPGYNLIKDNTFDTFSGHGAFIKTYSTNKLVIDNNTIQNPVGYFEGISTKAYDQYIAIRNNAIVGEYPGGSIGGNMNQCAYLDISFNNIIDGLPGTNMNNDGAIRINNDRSIGPFHFYRNTVNGSVNVKATSSTTGPFYFDNNVIVNAQAGTPSGSHITHGLNVQDPTRIILGSGGNANLVGYPADGIINAYGDLTSSYIANLGTKGYQTTASVCDSTHLYLCLSDGTCTTAGGYWDGSACLTEAPPVNGVCGSNDGADLTGLSIDSVNNCSAGTVTSFTGTGPWSWICGGIGTLATDASCSAALLTLDPDDPPGGGTGNVPYSPTNFARYSATSTIPYLP